MKRSEPSRRRRLRAVALSGAVLGLAGCATMPSSGPAALGPAASGNTQNTRVELIPVPPADGEAPDQLLAGFLDALGSDQADYRTARMYLSDPSWQPSGAVEVLDSTPGLSSTSGPGKTATVTATGTVAASLDQHGSYTPAPPNTPLFRQDYHFKQDSRGQWRIVDPPSVLLTSQRDFQRIYASVNKYYPAVSGHTGKGASPLVADPVYIRARVDNPLQTAAQQLLNGPSTWLQPVVSPVFPGNSKVELDTSTPQVKAYLSLGPDADWSPGVCRTMAAQLFTTLTQGTTNIQTSSSTVASVALYRDKNSSPVCSTGSEAEFNPVRVGTTAYFLSPEHQMESVTPSGAGAGPAVEDVPGKLVPTGVGIGSFAVTPGSGSQVASVSDDGRALYLSTLQATTAPTTPALRGNTQGALSSPSWDGTGTLWVVDGDPGGAPLRALVGGTPVPVTVAGLADGASIQQVRVAPDGARIALLVRNADASTSVWIGRVRRTDGDDSTHKAPTLTVEALRQTATSISSVSSLSWQDGDGLVVVGQQTGTTSVVPVEMDDSPSSLGTIQALSGVTDVTTLPVTTLPGDPLWLFATAKNTDDQNEIFVSQLTAFRWLPITGNSSSRGSGVRFPG
ncbi:LpqB family beta-propeller domain-containing protein [Streptacidiphilus pinicola]|uniref:LpqB family beta-propeller domain-containing protein n=1 Tax=Streptacidiphilus pinicola TaxID=2219663 RepID=UPI001401DAD4|nr:LpqB family beta-propeller domain-containing protein [Streptacidiphilus pinicola]